MSDTVMPTPQGSTLGQLLAKRESQLVTSTGKHRKALEAEVMQLRRLVDAYHPEMSFANLTERERDMISVAGSSSLPKVSSSQSDSGRLSGLHALAQMALQRPLATFLLILGIVSLYPLEQFLANGAAYWANPQLQQQARQLELDNAVQAESNKGALTPVGPCWVSPGSSECQRELAAVRSQPELDKNERRQIIKPGDVGGYKFDFIKPEDLHGPK